MSNRKPVIVAMSKTDIKFIRCMHTQKELTEMIEYPKLSSILCYHGVLTAQEFDELI